MSEQPSRVVVVAGGSSGIGRAIAETFAQNSDRVVIISRNEERLRAAAKALGANVTWQRADVGQREQVVAAVEAIVKEFGQITD